jgi:small-conductance mechanosensitive channel
MTTNWVQVLQYSFQSLWIEVVAFLPQFVFALIILIIGWIIGGFLKHVIEKIFSTLKVNQLLDAAGVDKLTERAGYKLKAGAFIGALVKWFVIIVFFVAALDVLNLDQVTVFFRDVVLGYLPQVIVAVLILFGAMIVANVLHKSVEAGARAAGFGSPELLGNFARYAIIVFAILAALSQLQIAPNLVEMLFAGFVFATSLALGLSFGLGGRDAAQRYVDSVTRKKNDSGQHHT